MRDAFGIGLEIDKIPGLQCIDRYLAARTILFIRSAGKNDALPVEYVLDEAGAVEASGCRAAKLVRYADIFLCFVHDGFHCRRHRVFMVPLNGRIIDAHKSLVIRLVSGLACRFLRRPAHCLSHQGFVCRRPHDPIDVQMLFELEFLDRSRGLAVKVTVRFQAVAIGDQPTLNVLHFRSSGTHHVVCHRNLPRPESKKSCQEQCAALFLHTLHFLHPIFFYRYPSIRLSVSISFLL